MLNRGRPEKGCEGSIPSPTAREVWKSERNGIAPRWKRGSRRKACAGSNPVSSARKALGMWQARLIRSEVRLARGLDGSTPSASAKSMEGWPSGKALRLRWSECRRSRHTRVRSLHPPPFERKKDQEWTSEYSAVNIEITVANFCGSRYVNRDGEMLHQLTTRYAVPANGNQPFAQGTPACGLEVT